MIIKFDDRKIFWYVDIRGGAGKSTFVNYFMARHEAACFSGGKIDSLAYAYSRERVVFFDLSKQGNYEYLYRFMEQLKNGRIFNSKYRSGMKFFDTPHLIVFSNDEPARNGFSADRIVLKLIRDGRIY